MRREYYHRVICNDSDCKETTIYVSTSRKQYLKDVKKHKIWYCIRHTNPEKMLSDKNIKTECIYICVLKGEYKYWQKQENLGTEKYESGFAFGDGYKAFAKDFSENTKLTIIAKIS